MCEMDVARIFEDFNASKFFVYICLTIFVITFGLRLDNYVEFSYWLVFLPLWIWKLVSIIGCIVGTVVYFRNSPRNMDPESNTQYQAMHVSTGVNFILLAFEFLACLRLEVDMPERFYWSYVFVPLIFLSVVSIGILVWTFRQQRSAELELFCCVNMLQFVFVPLRLDGFVDWPWTVIFIPLWITMCIALVLDLYLIILTIILLRSSDLLAERQRNMPWKAMSCTLILMLVFLFEIMLMSKLDRRRDDLPFSFVVLPLAGALSLRAFMCCGAANGNQWWFGIRKEFCPFLLDRCPLLQEYGNTKWKISLDDPDEVVDEAESVRSLPSSGSSTSTAPRYLSPLALPLEATGPSASMVPPPPPPPTQRQQTPLVIQHQPPSAAAPTQELVADKRPENRAEMPTGTSSSRLLHEQVIVREPAAPPLRSSSSMDRLATPLTIAVDLAPEPPRSKKRQPFPQPSTIFKPD